MPDGFILIVISVLALTNLIIGYIGGWRKGYREGLQDGKL